MGVGVKQDLPDVGARLETAICTFSSMIRLYAADFRRREAGNGHGPVSTAAESLQLNQSPGLITMKLCS